MQNQDHDRAAGRRTYRRQGLIELLSTVIGLSLMVWLYPLGTQGFEAATGVLCVAVLLYIVYRLATFKGVAERWGFPFAQRPDPASSLRGLEEDTFGCVFLGGFFLAGAVPMLFLRLVAPQEIGVSHPAAYFLWCIVQDFLFFALILRNLDDYLESWLAIVITAALFGFSHYPYPALMVVTALAGGVWGYAFLNTRSLLLVTLSHWLMGIVLLS